MAAEIQLTEDGFRALARSSPWPFTALHLIWRTRDDGDVVLVGRAGRLRVHDATGDRVIRDERAVEPGRRSRPGLGFETTIHEAGLMLL